MESAHEAIVDSVIQWFEKVVLGLNLCPFAAQPYREGRIRFELCTAKDDETCLMDIYRALSILDETPRIETLLLICPFHLLDFADYNQFLQLADDLVEQQGWSGTYQVASFHPHYKFVDVPADDLSNWTNRSPYPVFHLLREASLARAIDSHKDVASIPVQNIQRMKNLDEYQLEQVFSETLDAIKSRN